jgi:pimeloyl-ACP methyl ester carboxylesterase
MPESLPIVLVPGLNCSARLYAAQIPALWGFGPVTVANHTRDDAMAAIANRVLDDAPPRFALAGLSMGGYVALEIMRHAPERVAKLALLDTNGRDDSPEAQQKRRANIALAESGRFDQVIEDVWPALVHSDRRADAALKQIHVAMCNDVGPQAYVRQQKAILTRADSRPLLPSIRCPALVLVGAEDELTPPFLSEEIAAGISGARLVKVPECGHLSTLERPDAVNKALAEWMRL